MNPMNWLPWRGNGGRRWLAFAWLVLIAYRVLRRFVGRDRALSILESALSRAFRKHMHEYLEDRFGISQSRPEEAFDRIAENYKTRGERLFGPRFTYVQAIQTEHQSHTHITQCLFNDFFRAHGAAEVLPLFCAVDSIWIEELHQPRYRTRFERPTTLAEGDDACRFCFSRVPAAPDPCARRADR